MFRIIDLVTLKSLIVVFQVTVISDIYVSNILILYFKVM